MPTVLLQKRGLFVSELTRWVLWEKEGLPMNVQQDVGWLERSEIGNDALLVNRFISQRGNRVIALECYRSSVRLVRDFKRKEVWRKVSKRGAVNAFSDASRKRLKFTVLNSKPLVSQFGMSYHLSTPDGAESKRHLGVFLKGLRDYYPAAGYLWILEFQSRGTVHFHLFLTLPVGRELHNFLAESWHRIAEPDSSSHLRVHLHEKNFIAWDMRGGSYVCKYLDKRAQKYVPDGYGWAGRFWGSSRGLVPEPTILMAGNINEDGGKEVIRGLCRHHESALRGRAWQSRARKTPTCAMLPKGGLILERLLSNEKAKKQ